MSSNLPKDNMICDLGTIKVQSQLPISMSAPTTRESHTAATTRLTEPHRRGRLKVVTGPPKSLCLPHLCGLENIASVLIVRQESPWDTYRKVITYENAGKVTIATRRTRPSRMVAIRTYGKENARRLIYRFGRLENRNVLSLHECYMHEDLAFFLVDDLPLTLAHVVAFPSVYPSETELGSIICQILDGACYLSSFGLAHQSLACGDILFGIDGIIKIDCTPKQSEIAYIVALPSIVMRLMQKYDKDQGVVGVDDLERWPIDSAAVEFLSATETAESIRSLRNQPLLAGKHRPSDDLVVLARAALLSTSLNCIYDPGSKKC
ncbi:Pc16g14830 [Penicillium rubens Wisconsin 54-1255]|uniref:Pc16g14830 protein n=1 Tax=Penicillium rubens (strain ATCC 28089 / DSM 1075 / NRRL 1951 / Wisconsin 54-1255) TaxID=500485 RepID=B6HA29_PENRW|nr:Pc16g14830 [Penicillium rubens Wisconsin 54-1255]